MTRSHVTVIARNVLIIIIALLLGVDGSCNLTGFFVSSLNSTLETLQFDAKQSWILRSKPGRPSIQCRIAINSPECRNHLIAFTNVHGGNCSNLSTPKYVLSSSETPTADVQFSQDGTYSSCLFGADQNPISSSSAFVRISVQLQPSSFLMPTWLTSILICFLQFLSGLCSALNIGLMALDLGDLRILMEAGTGKQKRSAKTVYRLRQHGNFLLISILACNTAFNSVNTVLLESLLKGIGASVTSTIMVTIFGEIVPQAIGSRFALSLGYFTAWFTALMMIITSPVSWPAGKLLDFILGKQPPAAYPREKVQVLLREQVPTVKEQETAMIGGMLGLEGKSVSDHMRRLKDVYMLDYDSVFDENLYLNVCESGYSRIPVYRDNRTNIVGVVHIKDLSILGTYGHRTVGNVCDSFNLPFTRCPGNTNMNRLLMSVRGATTSHMVIVEDENRPDTHEAIGVITVEDIIEELLTFEILDEFDKNDQEKSKRSTDRKTLMSAREALSMQVKAVAIRLLTTLEPFTKDVISPASLSDLIEQSYFVTTCGYKTTFYTYNKPANFFMLIVFGRAILKMKNEGIQVEAGPFTYYGVHALVPPPEQSRKSKFQYVPEFTLSASEQIGYIAINRDQYAKACLEGSRSSILSLTQSIKSQLSVPEQGSADGSTNTVPRRKISE